MPTLRPSFRACAGALSVLVLAAVAALPLRRAAAEEGYAAGTVFHDRDRDGVRDPGEEGIPGVRVSNGREVVETDAEGRYRLPVSDDTVLFVVKPRGFMTPVDGRNVPRFFYLHKPAGSAKLRHAGLQPTGPLPPSVDFPLYSRAEPDRFCAVFLGDVQPANARQLGYLAEEIVPEIAAAGAAFGVALGDNVFDALWLLDPVAETLGLAGIPFYYALGNHDMNYDASSDRDSDETFERVIGPSYYSFDWGPVHFAVLDDVEWHPATLVSNAHYEAAFGEEQLVFLENDLAHVPEDRLVVLAMHIPLIAVRDRAALYRLLEKRPFSVSISAHEHYQRHVFIDGHDGFAGLAPHHHLINATACGSWWRGLPDERGIPHATMSDGAPNGYSLFRFDGNRYTIDFKAAARPADFQLSIDAPSSVSRSAAASAIVTANVFAGSERSTVEMRLGPQGPWTPLKRVVRTDPFYERTKRLEARLNVPKEYELPDPTPCHHLWQAHLPADPPPGLHVLRVRTKDMFGRSFAADRVIRIVP